MEKILITGGAGFIGGHLSDFFLRKGCEVSILDNFSSSSRDSMRSGVEIIEWDIRNKIKPEFFEDVDAVFHFAADPDVRRGEADEKRCFGNNVLGTLNVLEACGKAGVKRLVFASTTSVYGNSMKKPASEECAAAPISNYASSKLKGEEDCADFAEKYGMKTSVVRMANIVGEGSTHGVIFDFYKKLRTNPKRIEILGNGKQTKSYLHISDCISAIGLIFGKLEKDFEIFNVGSRKNASVDEVAHLVAKEMKAKPEFVHTGGEAGWAGDVARTNIDVGKLEKLGWEQRVSLEEGVRKYVYWLKENA
jgi:UDP-glucose 4-epimerase